MLPWMCISHHRIPVFEVSNITALHRCRTLLYTHADISIYNFVSNTMANHVWTPNTNANPDTGFVLAF